MLQSISGFFVRLAERWMPDPLVIAIALTMLCSAAAVAFTPFSVAETVDAWGEGYWSLLRFTAQMVLVLALGHVVAHTRPVHRGLVAIAGTVRSARMAYIGLTILAGLCALVSWGDSNYGKLLQGFACCLFLRTVYLPRLRSRSSTPALSFFDRKLTCK